MPKATYETADTIREQYETAVWNALNYAASMADKKTAEERTAPLAKLIDELAAKGWAMRMAVSLQTGTTGLMFYRIPKDQPDAGKYELPIEAMTDRELLVKLDDMIYAYDRRRDDELDYLDKHPNRDAWGDSERNAYEEICSDVHDQYLELWRVLDHIDRTRRLDPQTPSERRAAT